MKTLTAALVLVCFTAPGLYAGSVEQERQPDLIENSIGMKLARIPAGTFRMGGPRTNERPVREVRITRPFLMGVHEVTVGQFRSFVAATGYRTEAERDVAGGYGIDFATAKVRQQSGIDWLHPGFPSFEQGEDHPVLLVSWNDAEAFLDWLSEKEGRAYSLPTEAQWEYAARAGTQTDYFTGDDPASLCEAANIADAALLRTVPATRGHVAWDDGYPFTAPVGRFKANAFGLHDMHGNVWEWCADWYGEPYDHVSPVDDPAGPPVGRFRAIRGGGWFNGPGQNRSAQRIYFDPSFRYCLLSGFRVVLHTE